jgi:hypothetical protein
MIKYLLIQPDEDGAPNRFMTEEQLQEWLDDDEHSHDEWKLQTLEFMTEEDLLNLGRDQNYWGERKRLLLKIEFLTITPKEVKSKWVVE